MQLPPGLPIPGAGKKLAWVGLMIEILGLISTATIGLTLAQVATRNVNVVALAFGIVFGLILLTLSGLSLWITITTGKSVFVTFTRSYKAVEIIKFIVLLIGGLIGVVVDILFMARPGLVDNSQAAQFAALSLSLLVFLLGGVWEGLNLLNPQVGALGGLENRRRAWYEFLAYGGRIVAILLLMAGVSVFLNSVRSDAAFPAADPATPHQLTVLDRIQPLGNPIGALFTTGLGLGMISLIATAIFSITALVLDRIRVPGAANVPGVTNKLLGGKMFSEFSVLISTMGAIFASSLAIQSSASVLPNSTAAPALSIVGGLAALASTISGIINIYRFRADTVGKHYQRGVLVIRTVLSLITAIIAFTIAIWATTLVNSADAVKLFNQSAMVVLGGFTVGATSFVVELLNFLESFDLQNFKTLERIASVTKLIGFAMLMIALGLFYSRLMTCQTQSFAIAGDPNKVNSFSLNVTTNNSGTPVTVNIPVNPAVDLNSADTPPTLGVRFCAIPVDDAFVGVHGAINITGIALGSLGSIIGFGIGFAKRRAAFNTALGNP